MLLRNLLYTEYGLNNTLIAKYFTAIQRVTYELYIEATGIYPVVVVADVYEDLTYLEKAIDIVIGF